MPSSLIGAQDLHVLNRPHVCWASKIGGTRPRILFLVVDRMTPKVLGLDVWPVARGFLLADALRSRVDLASTIPSALLRSQLPRTPKRMKWRVLKYVGGAAVATLAEVMAARTGRAERR